MIEGNFHGLIQNHSPAKVTDNNMTSLINQKVVQLQVSVDNLREEGKEGGRFTSACYQWSY